MSGEVVPFMVCRECFRAAELEFRIASDGAGIPYVPLSIRDSLRLLRDFYRERRAAAPDDPRIAAVLAEVERRLAIEPVGTPPKLDA